VLAEWLESSKRVIEAATRADPFACTTDREVVARVLMLHPSPAPSAKSNCEQYNETDGATNLHAAQLGFRRRRLY